MRVYERGPDDGRKVVFVHGDATPCPVFSKIAEGLVRKGCRVILFGKRLVMLRINPQLRSSSVSGDQT